MGQPALELVLSIQRLGFGSDSEAGTPPVRQWKAEQQPLRDAVFPAQMQYEQGTKEPGKVPVLMWLILQSEKQKCYVLKLKVCLGYSAAGEWWGTGLLVQCSG